MNSLRNKAYMALSWKVPSSSHENSRLSPSSRKPSFVSNATD